MPVTQGSLQPVESEKIRLNRMYLLDNMDVTTFMDNCVNEEMLTILEVNQLDEERLTKKERNKTFLDFLHRSGDHAYGKFVKLLTDHGGKEIAKKLDDTKVDHQPMQVSEGKHKYSN